MCSVHTSACVGLLWNFLKVLYFGPDDELCYELSTIICALYSLLNWELFLHQNVINRRSRKKKIMIIFVSRCSYPKQCLEGSAFDSHVPFSGHRHSCLEDNRTKHPLAHHCSTSGTRRGSFQGECTDLNLIDGHRSSVALTV